MEPAQLTPQQIADIMENDWPSFDEAWGEGTAGHKASDKAWDMAISVIRTLSEHQFDDYKQLPESKETE
jgi:hypothetical protein